MRIILVAALIVAGVSLATAQSSTSTNFTTKPMTTAPAAGTQPNGQPRAGIPPPARSGESGLRVGEGAMDAGPLEVKRKK